MSSPQPSIPSDLQSVVDELGRSEQEAQSLVAGLTDTQLNWCPRNGSSWSMAQCLDHLARVNTAYVAALQAAVQQSDPTKVPRRGPIRPGWFSRFFIRSMDAPANRKFRAPRQTVPPPQIDGARALQSFVDSHEAIRAIVSQSLALDLNRVRFKNPFVRLLPFTVGTGLLIVLAHDRRHLRQAEQVRNGLSTPRS